LASFRLLKQLLSPSSGWCLVGLVCEIASCCLALVLFLYFFGFPSLASLSFLCFSARVRGVLSCSHLTVTSIPSRARYSLSVPSRVLLHISSFYLLAVEILCSVILLRLTADTCALRAASYDSTGGGNKSVRTD
jgi:hypothetical protein